MTCRSEGGQRQSDNDLRMRNRVAPCAALAMLICGASFQPMVAVGATPAPIDVPHPARPWKLSCTNGISGAFATAVTPFRRPSPGPASTATESTVPPQFNEVVLRNGWVNSASVAWKTSFGRGTKGSPQQCTLELHKAPVSTLRYSLTGAQATKLVAGPGGALSELILAYSDISTQNLQVTP